MVQKFTTHLKELHFRFFSFMSNVRNSVTREYVNMASKLEAQVANDISVKKTNWLALHYGKTSS